MIKKVWFVLLPASVMAVLVTMYGFSLCTVHTGSTLQRRTPVAHQRTSPPVTSSPAPAAVDPSRLRDPDQRTIFISVAAFRDSETADTLRELFGKAANPRRLFVGLVCQRFPDHPDEDCLPRDDWANCSTSAFCPSDQVRIRDFNAKLARGPTYARYIASLLYRGEDYFMMIDSHNFFVQNWDRKIIAEHDLCSKQSPKCVLSVYPMDAGKDPKTQNFEGRKEVAYLCGNAMWHDGGYPGPFSGGVVGVSPMPRPQPYVGAGLVFGSGKLVEEVPFDPHLGFLFHGEEILLTVRLWTHGYDFFSPGGNIIYHHYYRHGKPRMESTNTDWHRQQQIAVKRVQYILQLPKAKLSEPPEAAKRDLPKYGLGDKRTLAQYWRFARLDPTTRKDKEANTYWCSKYGGLPPYSEEWKQAAGYRT